MDIESFIVENAGNTCYIDSLLVALFFQNTAISKMLSTDVKDALIIYLQEFIREKFVNPIRNCKSVLMDDVEMLRTLCFQIGWRNNNINEFYNQQDVNEFFIFIASLFENEQIKLEKKIITEMNEEINKNPDIETIPFIPLFLPEDVSNIAVKNMLMSWLNDNIYQNNEQTNLGVYNIINSPLLLPLSINRFNNLGERINTDVIIQKKITLTYNEWYFHAAICHQGESYKSGHYYTLIKTNDDKWFIFDDLQTPCMKECRMDDIEITNKIKKHCVFLIYKKITI